MFHCLYHVLRGVLSGTSDPYVKFRVGTKLVYKSRIIMKNLNPQWDEKFAVPVEGVHRPVRVQVLDHDRVSDDPRGCSEFDLASLPIDEYVALRFSVFVKSEW